MTTKRKKHGYTFIRDLSLQKIDQLYQVFLCDIEKKWVSCNSGRAFTARVRTEIIKGPLFHLFLDRQCVKEVARKNGIKIERKTAGISGPPVQLSEYAAVFPRRIESALTGGFLDHARAGEIEMAINAIDATERFWLCGQYDKAMIEFRKVAAALCRLGIGEFAFTNIPVPLKKHNAARRTKDSRLLIREAVQKVPHDKKWIEFLAYLTVNYGWKLEDGTIRDRIGKPLMSMEHFQSLLSQEKKLRPLVDLESEIENWIAAVTNTQK